MCRQTKGICLSADQPRHAPKKLPARTSYSGITRHGRRKPRKPSGPRPPSNSSPRASRTASSQLQVMQKRLLQPDAETMGKGSFVVLDDARQ